MPESEWLYIVTDIETDGPTPGMNSMRSLASVAVSAADGKVSRFAAVLEPLEQSRVDPETAQWFAQHPEAWQAATEAAQPAQAVMNDYAAWLHDLPGPRTFAAYPLSFDGLYVDYYLRLFGHAGIHPRHGDDDGLFHGPSLCIASYCCGSTGRTLDQTATKRLPDEWLGRVEHTHQATHDAEGFANLLIRLLRDQPRHI